MCVHRASCAGVFGTVVDGRHCPRQRSSTRHVLADLTHACNFTRLHLKMTDTLPHAASADKRARTASSVRDSGRLGRRSALGALGVLGAALMAPQRAEAGFGPGVSTTISPPPVESLNLDQFLNLSERKRLQRARAGRNQVKRLLGELKIFTPSEMRTLQQELEEQVSLLSVLLSSLQKKRTPTFPPQPVCTHTGAHSHEQ